MGEKKSNGMFPLKAFWQFAVIMWPEKTIWLYNIHFELCNKINVYSVRFLETAELIYVLAWQ